MSDIQLSTIILEQGIDAYMEFCKQNPDALPIAVERYENAMSYAVGFWWLSLDDRTKTAQLDKHPVFAEKYSEKTCRDYGSVCNRIPTSIRVDVVQNISMKTTQMIVNSTSDPTELEFWFNLALTFPTLSARNLEMLIAAKKETPEIMPYVVGELPKQIAGKITDKTKKERLQKLLQLAKEQYKPVTVIEEKIVEKEVIKEVEIPVETIVTKEVEKPGSIVLKPNQKVISVAELNKLQLAAKAYEKDQQEKKANKGKPNIHQTSPDEYEAMIKEAKEQAKYWEKEYKKLTRKEIENCQTIATEGFSLADLQDQLNKAQLASDREALLKDAVSTLSLAVNFSADKLREFDSDSASQAEALARGAINKKYDALILDMVSSKTKFHQFLESIKLVCEHYTLNTDSSMTDQDVAFNTKLRLIVNDYLNS